MDLWNQKLSGAVDKDYGDEVGEPKCTLTLADNMAVKCTMYSP